MGKINSIHESEGFHDEDVFGNIEDDIVRLAKTGRRDPELEKEIINSDDPYTAFYYVIKVIKGRWPEGEEIIKTDSETAYFYAAEVIKDRWPEAEETIKTNPTAAYWYARDVIKGRWPEAEEIIKTNSEAAYVYAAKVIKDRWPEAEETIKQNSGAWNDYKSIFNIQESSILGRLTAKLTNPIVDHDTHVILNEAQVTDDVYNAYTKYWGKLDALPKNELDTKDISDRFGRLRPLSTWPTKSTRAVTKKRWDEYNRKLQTKTHPDEDEKDIDPCDDPDGYILQKMDDCLSANRHIGKETAQNKCSKQLGKIEQAIKAQCGEEDADTSHMLDRIKRRLDDVGGQARPEVDLDDPLLKSIFKALE